jgi:hypothetical protein
MQRISLLADEYVRILLHQKYLCCTGLGAHLFLPHFGVLSLMGLLPNFFNIMVFILKNRF